MSAEEHDHDHEDNYERAYGATENPVATPAAATPVHGYWRSLAELEGKAQFQINPALAANELPPIPVSDPLSRRNFFQLMGASMALAGVGACRYEKEEIVPLARRPEDLVPGTTQQYATACDIGGVGHALVATSFEGRPIKLDGNALHPYASGAIVPSAGSETVSHAGCSSFVQASILDLYDPDRSQSPLHGSAGTSLAVFADVMKGLRGNLGRVRVLSEASSSPTMRRLQTSLTGKIAGWDEYEPLSWDNERTGTKQVFDRPVRPLARLDRCEAIITIDCDLFVEHPASLRYSRDFARSRRMNGSLGINKMNRLWSIESTFTHTGAMADHRLALRSELGLPIAMHIDAELGGGGEKPAATFLKETSVARFLDALLNDLQTFRGDKTKNIPCRAVVIAGRRQPAAVHALVARINEKIGAVGDTLDYVEDRAPERPSHLDAIAKLSRDMAAGSVDTLVIIGGNPVYDAPADLEFAKALANVKTSIHLADYVNETSKKATWHVPRAHFLEAWGDTRTWDGMVTLAQPLIAPLYGGVSSIELVAMLTDESARGEDLVATTHNAIGPDPRDPTKTKIDLNQPAWRQIVHDGFVNVPPTFAPGLTAKPFTATKPQNVNWETTAPEKPVIEVTFHYSPFSYDGRFANNAWLQETPDFLTKVTWDNYALVSPETADVLKIKNDHMIKVKIGDRTIEVACYTMPGQARYSIALVLGGGRTAAGRVGGDGDDDHRVGWDTYAVRTTAGFDIAVGATVNDGDGGYELANVQEHWDIRNAKHAGLSAKVTDEGIAKRLPELVKDVTADTLVKDKDWHAEEGYEGFWNDDTVNPPDKRRGLSLFKEHTYEGHRWGMAIDLSTCTGCNSCMVACQAENNIPVVGRKEVHNNREMHWIRIDRYFGGSKEEPIIVHQPVTCQQCENAPCEQVCPVGATTHSDEGLNDQAYNRCIGTRYCANNCPYKVRKFNFLDWNKEWREARNKVRRLLFNPEVTVRMRGVMEKCTFCVQRIQNAKIEHKAKARTDRPGAVNAPLPDGTIVTACQQACPTEAIVFGDLSDPNSRVSRAHRDQRTYDLLPELYTKPRNKYLAKVRNPHPRLAAASPEKSGAAEPSHGGH
ncbi:MAG: Fe-S cluster-containing hydrogenase [Kofleriaceae bacterium]